MIRDRHPFAHGAVILAGQSDGHRAPGVAGFGDAYEKWIALGFSSMCARRHHFSCMI
jgi:hypothetical protein